MEIADTNILYDAMKASMKESSWKREPNKYYHLWLTELKELKDELDNRTYKTSSCTEFTLNERGKIRHIHGNRMRDRTVRHALCDNVLGPCTEKYMIYNNGASQKGKGVSFAREMFERDLHNYWLEHGDNKGYIGFVDLSKFYDNIQHEKIKESLYPIIPEDTHWLMDEILSTFEVDVSYMTDEEYARCMDEKFDSVKYYEEIPPELRTGKKMMAKSVNIGDQVSQIIGVFYPTPIDNYCKIVRGLKRYGRYMDDIYFVVETREEALDIIKGIKKIATELGLFVNDRKTHVAKMSDTYKYLQIRYTLTDKGRVIRRINPKCVTRERRKLKAYKGLMEEGVMSEEDIENSFKSWIGTMYRYMSNRQITNMLELYYSLYGGLPKWKEHGKLRWLTAQYLKGLGSTETTSSPLAQSMRQSSRKMRSKK